MKSRYAAMLIVAIAATFGQTAHATNAPRCDTWHRRYAYAPNPNNYQYTDHNATGNTDQPLVTSGQTGGAFWATLKVNQGQRDPRYGVSSSAGWVEADGGGGDGSNGYPFPYGGGTSPGTGEGGVVQGDLHPGGAADVNFSVWSFSLDDESQQGNWQDTYTGACVDANGTMIDQLGHAPTTNPSPSCSGANDQSPSGGSTSDGGCWRGSTGQCVVAVDPQTGICNQGIVLPTSRLP